MWHQRARTNWMRDGDKNTAFSDIAKTFQNYFQSLFTSRPDLEWDRTLEAVDTKLTEDMNDRLTTPFTMEEIS